MVKMKAPDDNKSGAGFNGEFYPLAEDGTVTVPPEAVADLNAHGFCVVEIGTTPAPAGNQDKRPNAADTIAMVNAAETLEALNALAEGEERVSVIAAIEKRRATLTPAPAGNQE